MKPLNIAPLLDKTLKPSRYLGSEIGARQKTPSEETTNFCLIYPDTYEVGFSHLGVKVLYSILNNQKAVVCDRAYAPDTHTAQLLGELELPLFGVESKIPVKEFDCVGFTLQTELTYSNILYCLEIARIPALANERAEHHPIVIAGGPCAYNPLPLADFFDLFLLGDGEEAIIEIAEVFAQKSLTRQQKLEKLAKIDGTYLPAFGKRPLKARKCKDLNNPKYQYDQQLMPLINTVHNRYVAQVMRGCLRGCRFCQAGYIYRPLREYDAESLYKTTLQQVNRCRWEDASLLSLSTGDYSQIKPLLKQLVPALHREHSKTSLPSLRLDSLDDDFIGFIDSAGQKGLTIAPEAGSQRLRDIINKNISEEDILKTIRIALAHKWQNLKLYFMIGLPFEQEQDITAIPQLIDKIVAIAGKKLHINITISPFIPKPFTPFQWQACASVEYIRENFFWLKNELKKYRFVKLNHLDFFSFLLEAHLALGDRDTGKAILHAYQEGAKMDGWSEHLNSEIWTKHLKAKSVAAKSIEQPLPWDFIDCGVNKEFLLQELQKSKSCATTSDCYHGECTGCGVCNKDLQLQFSAPMPQHNLPPIKKSSIPENIQFRYRIFYKKSGNLKYLGHLDFIKHLYRVVLTDELPLIFTSGYHKKPKLKFCPPLPLGVEGQNEYLDIFLRENIPTQKVLEQLKPNYLLPILEVQKVSKTSAPTKEIYQVICQALIDPLKIEKFLAQDIFTVVNRKAKEIDLKKVVTDIQLPTNRTLLIYKKIEGASINLILSELLGLTSSDIVQIERVKFLFN